MSVNLPNVHKSEHPVLQVKISLLRSKSLTSAKQVRIITNEISQILAVEASAKTFSVHNSQEKDISALGYEFSSAAVLPEKYVLVPILRSGLSMLDAFQTLLPDPDVPVYHLGIFRDTHSLVPVEYYNKLPNIPAPYDLAFIIDPIIATGGTASAVIQTLKEWNVKRIVYVAIISSESGLEKIASLHPDIEFHVGTIDHEISPTGYIIPGIGDIGDRLHSTNH